MKCLSCQVDIDPKWKHAIDNNVCPFCGDHIMPEDLKNNIISLREVISSFKEKYSDQLDDLLFSNYNYVRTDSSRMKQFIPEPKIVYRNVKKSDSIEESPENINSDSDQLEEENVTVQDPEVTSKFFKNAEASKSVARASELKKLVSEIKTNNPELVRNIKSSKNLEDYPEEYENVNSSMDYDNDDDDQIPPAVLAFANQNKGKISSDHNPKDILKLQQRAMQARKNVINGTGGKGSFSRG